ncbi:LysR family transcriptional regulator [Ruegeria sp.]|uniref:LysR family transcriptional regulator n=1 Tax=Ruegeria sp. TaxID=1879320 RepID=UPI003C7D32E1
MRFTLRQLSYFVAAGETGSVTRAAERVNISQPSVSAAIAHLETEFGVQLFVRQHAQGLALTPAGKRLLKAAKQSLQSAHDLYSVANESSSAVTGSINVGSFKTFAPLIVPKLWNSFKSRYPDVSVNVSTGSEAEMLSGLRSAQLDIALTYEIHLSDDMLFQPLAQLPTYVLVAADHKLASKDAITLSEIADEPFVLLNLPLSGQYFLSLFERERLKPHIVTEVTDSATLRSYVAAGIGYSLMTARPMNNFAETGMPLAYIPLKGDYEPMVIGLASLKEIKPTSVVTAFQDHCKSLITSGKIPGMQPY